MAEYQRITGGIDEFVSLIRRIERRVSSLETRGTGSIYMSDQMITSDPNTGVETIFGVLPDGTYGLQQWVNDTEPPEAPSPPVVTGDRAIFEIKWDGTTSSGIGQPLDYDYTALEMSSSSVAPIWTKVNYFTSAGRVVVGGQPYGEERFFRLISYDKNGNASLPSAVSSTTLVSFMQSPEMTSYINEVEGSVTTATNNASAAQEAAATAARLAQEAKEAAANAGSPEEIAALRSIAEAAQLKADQAAAEAVEAARVAGTARDTANGKNTVWYLTSAPAGTSHTINDIWFDTDDNNKPYRWTGSIWEARPDTTYQGAIVSALDTFDTQKIAPVRLSVDGKNSIYSQPNPPTAPVGGFKTNDVWFDTNDNNKPHIWSGSAWISRADTSYQGAITSAINTYDTEKIAPVRQSLDGKNSVYSQPTPPSPPAGGFKTNDIWFDTDDTNKPYTWTGTIWSSRADTSYQEAINTFETSTITPLRQSVDLKNSVYSRSTPPEAPTGGFKVNDIWFDTANKNEPKVWDGSNWVSARDATISDVSNSLTSVQNIANSKNTITNSTVNPDKVGISVGDLWWKRDTTGLITGQWEWSGGSTIAGWKITTFDNAVIANINAGKINAGTLDAARIGAKSITAEKMFIGSGTNLIIDPQFEAGTAWNNSWWIDVAGTGMNGGRSLVIPAGTGQRGSYLGSSDDNYRIKAVPGARYRIGVWVKTTAEAATNTIAMYARAYSTTNTFGFTVPGNIANTATVVPNTWQQISGIVTFPESGYISLTVGLFAQTGYTGSVRFSDPFVQSATDTTLIADGSITTDKIGANAVTAVKILAGAVETDKLAANSVTALKISSGAVETDKLAAGAVTAAKILAGAVEADKLAANSVTALKISSGAVETDKLAAGAVTAVKILAGAVETDKLAANSVTAVKIVSGAVEADKIAAGAVTADKMLAGTITAASGIIGSLDAAKITVGEMDGTRIKAGTVFADRLVVGQGENFIVDSHFPAPTATNLTAARIAGSPGSTWVSPNRIGWTSTTAASNTQQTLRLGNNPSNVSAQTIPVVPGRRYIITWRVFSDVTSTTIGSRAAVRWLFNTGTSSYVSAIPTTYAPISSVGLSSEISNEIVAPENAVSMTVDLQFNGLHGGGRQDFLRPEVRLMTDGTVITKDAILAKHIKAGEITGNVLDVSYIRGQIVTSTMFEGSTFSGGTFQNATFQTSPTANTGIKMSPSLGLVGYNTSNQPVFQVDTAGNATFTGTVNITGGSVPQSVVPGLVDTLADHSASADTVWSWTDPANRTLIEGSNISTGSISADRISLGSSENYIYGGYGEASQGWTGYTYKYTGPNMPGWPPDVVGVFELEGAKLGFSPYCRVDGLNKYSFSYIAYHYKVNSFHELYIEFYDLNGTILQRLSMGRKSGSGDSVLGTYSLNNQTAPAGAATVRIAVEHNWKAGDLAAKTSFSRFVLTTGAQTRLTASGLTSYNAGVQTVRLNGENNLVIGDLLSGRPGVEPYIKMGSTSQTATLDFLGLPGGVANRGNIWYDVGNSDDGYDWGKLSIFAMNDAGTTTRQKYAAGMDLFANGGVRLFGYLSMQSETFQSGSYVWAAPGFAANAFGEYTINFHRTIPSAHYFFPQVFLSLQNAEGLEMVATLKSVSNTGFTVTVKNLSPNTNKTSGRTELRWLAVRM